MAGWDLGDTVRAERVRRKLSQEALGRQIGVSKDSISRFERGLASLSLAAGARLAQKLELDVPSFVRRLADARGESVLLNLPGGIGHDEPRQSGREQDEGQAEDPEPDECDAFRPEDEKRTDEDAHVPADVPDEDRRRAPASIEKRIDLRDLRLTVRLSFAQPALLEILVAPA